MSRKPSRFAALVVATMCWIITPSAIALSESVPLIGAPMMWGAGNSGYTGKGTIIAVVDSGVEWDHPFFRGANNLSRVIAGYCFSSACPAGVPYGRAGNGAPANASPCSHPVCVHGTTVAGVAAGRNGIRNGVTFSGVAPDSQILAIQIFSPFPDGGWGFHDTDLVEALTFLRDLKAQGQNIAAVNMSIGRAGSHFSTQAECSNHNPAITNAVANLANLGVAVVAIAGNDNQHAKIDFPGCVPNVISVAATNKQDEVAQFSNDYPELTLFAPGVDIWTSSTNWSFSTQSGTSMAVPHVSGAIAVLREKFPDEPLGNIIARLKSGPMVTDPWNPSIAKPRLNADVLPRLVNIATRARILTGNDVLINGFIIQGTTAKNIAIKAKGPSLANFGITSPLADPFLYVYRTNPATGGSDLIATNDNWGNPIGNKVALEATRSQPTHEYEPGLYLTLPPGSYTAIATGVGGSQGIAVLEINEVYPGLDQNLANSPQSQIINLAARGIAGSDEGIFIPSFIIRGQPLDPMTVVIRARGPTLGSFGISNYCPNPTLQLNTSPPLYNDNWETWTPTPPYGNQYSSESAIYVQLLPGGYTTFIQNLNGAGCNAMGLVDIAP